MKTYNKMFEVLEGCQVIQDMNLTYPEMMDVLNHKEGAPIVKAKQLCNAVLHKIGITYNIDDYNVDDGYNPMMEQILTLGLLAWMDVEVYANYTDDMLGIEEEED